MAVFVELVSDAFEDVFRSTVAARQNTDNGRASRAGRPLARRPTRGIEIKDDTYAAMKVVLSNGQEWPLLDSSSVGGYSKKGYSNFLLQQVTEQRMEKHQIVETFGDSYVFFFGESPRFLNCTAILVNTLDFNWRAEWWFNYENYLRGTKLVELGARCYMFWDDNIVEGYMINCQASETSQEPYTVSMQFKFFVTKYQNVSLSNVENYPVRSSVVLPEGVELTNTDAFERIQQSYRGDSAGSRAQDAVPREQSVISSAAGRNEKNKITQKIRQLPSSLIVDPEVWNRLTGTVGTADIDRESLYTFSGGSSGALRGLIIENIDEYVGGGAHIPGPNTSLGSTEDLEQGGRLPGDLASSDQQEVESLEDSTINTLEAIGCDANNERTLRDLGLGPNFSPGWRQNSSAFAGAGGGLAAGIGASVGASASIGAAASASVSFSPQVNASAFVGASASAGIGVSARAGAFANAAIGANTTIGVGTDVTLRDPLGSVYGRTEVRTSNFSSQRRQYVEGGGDYEYGYISAYGRVGFGRAGYGDFGGTGFGSCNADGDPGFLDPDSFSYENVSEERSAFNSFIRARNDQTAVTRGSVFGSTIATGGASIEVGGRATAFALVALEGRLESWVVQESAVGRDLGGAVHSRRSTRASVVKGPGSFSATASAAASISLE